MTPAKLLLIEDTPSDATLFCDQIQNELGNEVQIEWKTRLSDALAWLEAGSRTGVRPDQIWLDPGLPDLGQQGLAKALSTLKQYVDPGELRLLSSTVAPAVARTAEREKVDVLPKDSLFNSNTEILKIVQDLVSKRSGGITTRVELFKLETAIAKVEHQVSENIKRMERIESVLEQLATARYEINGLKEAVAGVRQQIEKLQGQKAELGAKRLDVFGTIIVTLVSSLTTVVLGLGTIALPHLLKGEEVPNPLESRPASPKPSPQNQTPKS